jgi:deoxyribonuclease-4
MLGAHMSIAGGCENACLRAAALNMDCVQLFTKNNTQWRAKPISSADALRFRQTMQETGLAAAVVHNSYLINLAANDRALWRKSIAAMVVELERAAKLGIDHVVAHPGSHGGAGIESGILRVAKALDRVFESTRSNRTCVALETTAGQGSGLGYRFEHLAQIIRRCAHPDRLRVCLDTCHVFAAGYPLAPRREYRRTMREFDRIVGLDRLVAIHLNDSKRPLGSRVDRHQHIGKGFLGLEPFELLLNDRRLARVPMILETPKATDPATGQEWDAINLRVLRGLIH